MIYNILLFVLINKIKYFVSAQNQLTGLKQIAGYWKQAPRKAKRLNDPSAKAIAKRSSRAATSIDSSSPGSSSSLGDGFMPL